MKSGKLGKNKFRSSFSPKKDYYYQVCLFCSQRLVYPIPRSREYTFPALEIKVTQEKLENRILWIEGYNRNELAGLFLCLSRDFPFEETDRCVRVKQPLESRQNFLWDLSLSFLTQLHSVILTAKHQLPLYLNVDLQYQIRFWSSFRGIVPRDGRK